MTGFTFLHLSRGIFFLIVLIILCLFRFFIFKKEEKRLPPFPLFNFKRVVGSGRGNYIYFSLKNVFIFLFLGFIFLGISDFRREVVFYTPSKKGIDIAIALDISTSMSAKDFKPDRLSVSKEVIRRFIEMRKNDKIALLTFAANTYVVCPLTSDHRSLLNLLDRIELIPFDMDGTAIGMAIVNGINLLRNDRVKSKVLILVTDGSNNRGEISPLTASKFAKKYGIKIYTIGIGSGRETEMLALNVFNKPVYVKRVVKFDEDTLLKIAKMTGGVYFRANDKKALLNITEKIDVMEKTPFGRRRKIKRVNLEKFLFSGAIIFLFGYLFLLTFVEKSF